jgi:hypothetical protein
MQRTSDSPARRRVGSSARAFQHAARATRRGMRHGASKAVQLPTDGGCGRRIASALWTADSGHCRSCNDGVRTTSCCSASCHMCAMKCCLLTHTGAMPSYTVFKAGVECAQYPRSRPPCEPSTTGTSGTMGALRCQCCAASAAQCRLWARALQTGAQLAMLVWRLPACLRCPPTSTPYAQQAAVEPTAPRLARCAAHRL